MEPDDAVSRMATLLRETRRERGISLRQLAHHAGVRTSVACRAEGGGDAKLSTWEKLFHGLGYRLLWEKTEYAEETADLLSEEADRRLERSREGLCSEKRRFY